MTAPEILTTKTSTCAKRVGIELERGRAEETTKRSYQTQDVFNALLRISMHNIPLSDQLEQALDVILAAPLMRAQPKGGIFLQKSWC